VEKTLIPALIGAVSGAIVAIIGWFVSNALTLKRETAARRDIAARVYLESQIEQLYGPLLGLIQHSRMAFGVASQKLPTVAGRIDFSRFSASDGEIWTFFIETYFLPVDSEIRQLIRSKMHLLESGILPDSFGDFFKHEVQFEALHRLWKEKGVDSSEIHGPGWPNDLERDVQTVLDRLRSRHQVFLQRLGASGQKVDVLNQ
jgi:hypothetical protein